MRERCDKDVRPEETLVYSLLHAARAQADCETMTLCTQITLISNSLTLSRSIFHSISTLYKLCVGFVGLFVLH